jgi:hypothetical protein
MLLFATGLATLVGYIVFERNFPKRPIADKFELTTPITKRDNYLRPPKLGVEYNDITEYDFKCKIRPSKAMTIDGQLHDMRVPDEFIIRKFTIGVKTLDNTVQYVYLGHDTYHSDKCEKTQCFYLSDLFDTVLCEDFVGVLMTKLMTYELENSMSHEHWENDAFLKLNKKLINQLPTE